MASIIGLSGPSSSGKTTLTRLLQRIFNSSSSSSSSDVPGSNSTSDSDHERSPLRTFIIHEDDFYHSDDRIPITTLPSGQTIQDWDCAGAIDIPFLRASLAHVRATGSLPPRLLSKEDLNEVTDSGVPEEVVLRLRGDVQRRLQKQMKGKGKDDDEGAARTRVVAFLEGFLLFAPTPSVSSSPSLSPSRKEDDEGHRHPLRSVHELLSVRLFLPAPYDKVKKRRESRSGYVTIGPAPTPTPTSSTTTGSTTEGNSEEEEVDIHAEDDRPPQNFWTDPPGYVDDIVWPRYVQDHAWLLLPEKTSGQEGTSCRGVDPQEAVKLVGQGVNVRTDAGVTVAPGQGELPMVDILQWAVEEVMKYLEGTQ
ncbi:ribosylnicotinamide kinase [Aspergillus melleus]|uniref:ribosylnicotinamide kinase n=1 Tax=Aspergillus melleus TaxID=138277 RepID=UPI001E8CAD39|nr:ribosylnicotinamide kinase [Aspergillus melleus]KAH8428305.1 ribosylnicotinamide kinase [Aspergillus melleus]